MASRLPHVWGLHIEACIAYSNMHTILHGICANLGLLNGPRLAHNRAHGKAVSEHDATNAVFPRKKIVLKHDEH
jgi:hypothetical protein